ncbi:RecQ family ATP-dependent DNA helicase [Salipaludibacillus neizhouensis]|uniref:RecQ family ATP-dependent DNA helicase n=1 Tax=Salipaludibacillus neizhouensis TaxID=885475 RepID=UPI00160046F0|nr:ATP-dependent DNA helicase RecQ [Salipaludibacillus neizhouensis]
MSNLDATLKNLFGFDTFREGQREIIEAVMNQQDVLAILPTGRGKTLCYHLPSLILGGLTLVISPLVSLMEDQVTQMKASGNKRVAHLSSLLNQQEKQDLMMGLGNLDLLFLSPEMASLPFVKRALVRQKITLFVIDEAHCISHWGHEFRTDYLRLNSLRSSLGNPSCLALTATATPLVEKDIRGQLKMENEVVIRYPVNRENIYIGIEEVASVQEKHALLIARINQVETPAIIYTGTRQETERIAGLLKRETNFESSFYHGGLTKEDRLLIQHQFIHDELDIICCTNAFGMGINKSNVRTVIHLHLPSSIEQYVQEIGRAGRDQSQSTALLIYQPEDHLLPLSFIENEFPDDDLLNHLSDESDFSHYSLEELRNFYQLDDNSYRMLHYYLDQENLIEEGNLQLNEQQQHVIKKLRVKFQTRKKEKILQLERIKSFVLSRTCLRRYVSHYFEEEILVLPEFCCSQCQLTETYLKEIDSINYNVRSERSIHKESDWSKELENMLITNAGGLYGK